MDFPFFNALLTNKYTEYTFGLLLEGYLDNFIDSIDIRYRKVIIDNEIIIRNGYEFDAVGTPIKPSKHWDKVEDESNYVTTVAEFREHLNFEVIRIESAILKDSVLAWKLKLIGIGNKEIIKMEYENTMFQLLVYETEFQNAVHLKPYSNLLLDIIKDIRNDISILTLYFKENFVGSESSLTLYKESVLIDKENKFNGVPINDVKTHFESLTTLRSKKNNKPHITQEQLAKFIKIAFLQENEGEKEKIRMNLDKGELHTIRKVFYDFYKTHRQEYESTRRVKEKYVKLLTDNFEGFDYTKIANNFDK